MKEVGLLIALGIGLYLLFQKQQQTTMQAAIQAKIQAAHAAGTFVRFQPEYYTKHIY